MSDRPKLHNLPWPLALPALVLAVSALIQGSSLFRTAPKPRALNLARSIPAAVPGWKCRDVPLGTNEFLSGEVARVLNYDEVVNREYTRDGVTFGIYVVYWGAGKMPTQLVASHTPDHHGLPESPLEASPPVFGPAAVGRV